MFCLSLWSKDETHTLFCAISYNCAVTLTQGVYHERLAATSSLCLTNGTVVSKIQACLVMEFTDNVKVNDPHEQPLLTWWATCGLSVLCPTILLTALQGKKEHPPSSNKFIVSVVWWKDLTLYSKSQHTIITWRVCIIKMNSCLLVSNSDTH